MAGKKRRSGIKARFSPMLVRAWVEKYEDGATCEEIAQEITDAGVSTSHSTVWRILFENGCKMRKRGKRTPMDIMLS